MTRRTKIVCTLGPAVDTLEQIEKLILAGMNVARLNYAQGSPTEHGRRIALVREASKRLKIPVAILQDLCGPKIRTLHRDPVELQVGGTHVLVGARDPLREAELKAQNNVIGVDYDRLSKDLIVGSHIMFADGHLQMLVTKIEGEEVHCVVEHGGTLRPRAGVNLPADQIQLPALTTEDREHLKQGLAAGVDWVSLSFVREASEVHELRALCASLGRPTPVISKIETPSAIRNLDSIVRASDGIMVARGDLGVEFPPEDVPVLQRQIVEASRLFRKPVIVATEMLQSMIHSSRPTRAETSDVAAAVYGGADAVMLSAETAIGEYAVGACTMMARIIERSEESAYFDPPSGDNGGPATVAIAYAARQISTSVGAQLIVALTESGATAQLVSKARPQVPIIAYSSSEVTLNRLALLWGVEPAYLEGGGAKQDLQATIDFISRDLKERQRLASGQSYVLTYGVKMGVEGSTNALRVETLP
ncbi:MAG: pyruvate kinase [Polyangiaceae bacterium]|nr:pyruvate kinase [Polyangiaceae bacterium]